MGGTRRTTLVALAAAAFLLVVPAAARAQLRLAGDLVFSYDDFDSQSSDFSLDQVDLTLYRMFDQTADVYVRATAYSSGTEITEAWLRYWGLPAAGRLTIGKFYRPLGVSLPLATSSIPTLMFHSATDYGVKAEWGGDAWSLDLGLVNGVPVTPMGSTVGKTRILSNLGAVAGADFDANKEVFARFGVSAAEDWGSLSAGAMYAWRKLDSFELRLFNLSAGAGPLPSEALFRTTDRDDRVQRWDFDVDYTYGPWHLWGEYVEGHEGRLVRRAWVAAGSYRWKDWTLMAVRDGLDLDAEIVRVQNPLSWDRRRSSISLEWKPLETLSLQAQYEWNQENVLNRDGGRVENDGLTIQSIYYF